MIHFDVGSSALYNPASHDATVVPPDAPPPPLPGACCTITGNCVEILETECEAQHGVFLGPEIPCGPNTCGE